MSYTRVNWQNKPSTATPINATNLNTMDAGIAALDTAMADKVDKVAGKGLSTEDFTTEEKTKLAGIEDGAEVNVQADWGQTDDEADDYIKNKPDLSVYAERDELWTDATQTGNPVTIKTQSAQNAKQTILTMTPIQSGSGTPAPDNVRPITGRTQAQISGCGGNVMDDDLESGSQNQVTYTVNADKSITVNGTATATSGFMLFTDVSASKLNLMPGVTYYIGHNAPTSNVEIQVYVDGVFFNNTTGAKKAITIPSTATSSYARLRVRSGLTVNNAKIYPMIALHDYTEWEAPKPKTSVTISLGQTVYGGTLNVETGELTIDRQILDLGTLNWSLSTSSGHERFNCRGFVDNIVLPSSDSTLPDIICSQYATATNNQNYNHTVPYSVALNKDEAWIYVYDPDYTDAQTFTAAMNGVKVCFKLATPTTATLTAAQVALLKGINNVSTDADSLTITYFNDAESIADADNRITGVLGDFAKVEGKTASQNYVVGDYLVFDDKFCKASVAIATGETLAIGTNLTQTTIGAELKSIIAQL